jgi:hypothetical protein
LLYRNGAKPQWNSAAGEAADRVEMLAHNAPKPPLM